MFNFTEREIESMECMISTTAKGKLSRVNYYAHDIKRILEGNKPYMFEDSDCAELIRAIIETVDDGDIKKHQDNIRKAMSRERQSEKKITITEREFDDVVVRMHGNDTCFMDHFNALKKELGF